MLSKKYFLLFLIFLYLNIMQQQSNWFSINSTDKTEATARKTQTYNENSIIHT